jgi:hypoxanthine phosphoribosyltransferase
MKLARLPISERRIRVRIKQLAAEINEKCCSELIIISVINGALIFTADLIRELNVRVKLDTIKVSSYTDTKSNGTPRVDSNLKIDICGKHVLIVDDILDTGNTLSVIHAYLAVKGPTSISTCVLLDKKERRVTPYEADFVGFTIPDEFVIGYGLDYNEDFRNMKCINVKHFPFG